jgi:uncharacterized protein (TIGR00725 family)
MDKLINKQWRTPEAINEACAELREVMELLNKIATSGKRIAVFMGSARLQSDDPLYIHCKETAKALGQHDFAVMNGGGTGIMQAASEGIKEGGGESIALKTALIPCEQVHDSKLHDHQKAFKMFFNRRFGLLTAANCVVIYPGGFGTLNEFSELIMLLQMKIVDNIPVYLAQSRGKIGDALSGDQSDTWGNLQGFMKTHMGQQGYIKKGDEDNIGKIINIEDVDPKELAKILNSETS